MAEKRRPHNPPINEPSPKVKKLSGTGKLDGLADKADQTKGFLSEVTAYVVPTGIGNARAKLFRTQLEKFGGSNITSFGKASDVSHIVVDEKMTYNRLLRILKVDDVPSHIRIVTSQWLSTCLKEQRYSETEAFEVPRPMPKATASNVDGRESNTDITMSPSTSGGSNYARRFSKLPPLEAPVGQLKRVEADGSDASSDYETDDDAETRQEPQESIPESAKKIPKGNWVCAISSSNPRPNYNKHITDKLEALAKTYENTNDRWRALGYAKAIMTLKRQPKPITTWEEAKSLPGVGDKLADKIWEIIESGELRKLDELSSQEEIQAINLFTNIWGAGAHTARAWVAQGFRTLDDLKTKAHLTRHQTIGLKYYDELLDRMPRSEAAEIEAVVVNAAKAIDADLIALACGSYRRGKSTCGDVDVLITHPDGKSHKGVFPKILAMLHDSGFLTDDLVIKEEDGNQKKYLGICQLPGEDRKHRRLDIIVVPYSEYACAIMYFTGSAHFNRSMRNLAGKMGMSLSEHSLNTGVTRKNGQKLNDGVPLHTPTEESVFQHLGLKYRPPEERDH